MRYICCIWLCIVWLVCHAQNRANGLHIQKAPEIVQRITRQATRYSSAGSGASSPVGSNYRPVATQASNYNVRNVAVDPSPGGLTHALSGGSGQRTAGVGAFSFGGMASGRPTNGNSFAVNTAPLGKVVNNGIKAGGPIRSQPQPNQSVVGGIGKPNQLQQALLQAAQYQYQQKQQYQQQQQQQYQQQQQQQYQQQPLRRQIPQQVYRQRPAAASSYEYQQFN